MISIDELIAIDVTGAFATFYLLQPAASWQLVGISTEHHHQPLNRAATSALRQHRRLQQR